MAAHHLHEHAGLPERNLADGMMNSHRQAAEPLHRLMGEIAQHRLSHGAVGFVAQAHQPAVLRMCLIARSAEEYALCAGRLGKGNNRLDINRMVEQLDLNQRQAIAHAHMVARQKAQTHAAAIGGMHEADGKRQHDRLELLMLYGLA